MTFEKKKGDNIMTGEVRRQAMKHETGTTLSKTYYGVRETYTLHNGDTLEVIRGVYSAKPEDTEEFTGGAGDIFISWYETEGQAQAYYEERHREMVGEECEDEDDDDEDWAARRRSLQADAEVKHAIEHGYAGCGAW
jgi:hypothetical protein